MTHSKWPKFTRSWPHTTPSGWLVLIPSVLVIGLVLLFTPVSSASPVPSAEIERAAQAQPPADAQGAVCQTCHPSEYSAWENTPHKTANVSCETCHGPYKEGHPAKTTMQLPMASDTCETCHNETFGEWKTSQHATRNIECFDCHNAHTQGLRTGSEEKLCAACHSDRQTQVSHATHGINGVDCASCHMAPENQTIKVGSARPSQGAVRSHTFKVAGDVCAKCHEGAIHNNAAGTTGTALVSARSDASASSGAVAAPGAAVSAGQVAQNDPRVPQLQGQVNDLQARIDSLRGAAALTMGLAFGVGGFLGLLAGVVGAALLHRRNS